MIAFARPAPAAAAGDILVAAQETEALVAPREANAKLVNLPALKFELRAAFKCKGEPVSLTLSVADTFSTLGSDALAEQRAAETILTVPPQQLALVASKGFCIDDDPDTANELLVPGLATVHASLHCVSDTGTSAHFASAPLKVRLICAREPSADQEASAPSPER